MNNIEIYLVIVLSVCPAYALRRGCGVGLGVEYPDTVSKTLVLDLQLLLGWIRPGRRNWRGRAGRAGDRDWSVEKKTTQTFGIRFGDQTALVGG